MGRIIRLDLIMDLFFTKFKRLFITLGLSVLCWISGEVLSHYELEQTGVLFILTSMGLLVYLLLFWLFNRKIHQPFSIAILPYELRVIPVLFAGICLMGIIESDPNQPDFAAVFILLFIYTILFVAVLITNYFRQIKGNKRLSKSFINKLMFWSFAIGIGRIIILVEEYGDSDALIIIAFFYFPLLIILTARWIFKQTRAILALKNEKAKTELLHLKSQVNPHFFFNMLNNLYGLVEVDSKKAQELILKLSDMMRYSIYEGEKETVTLKEEVDYLKNYIELHKMRYHKNIDISFKEQFDEDCRVMPLLFIILLENAFKHGVENLRENAFVHINVITFDDKIQFDIENNFDASEVEKNAGIGLKNLKRRLELVYENKFKLSISTEENVYKATLILNQL
ncbi:sensor histidine kinase [Urechidicola vernalis]|uniref:Histidine kinase n=1 Tax=Urechidicola vernalis TaxID=3075600 RepID=A0ABU2Y6V5_9FLAO|nr:histidine kinase [Urechidicola sp. P050]MDT0553938.1 histidine kinase [Urechidicola sp. P050]